MGEHGTNGRMQIQAAIAMAEKLRALTMEAGFLWSTRRLGAILSGVGATSLSTSSLEVVLLRRGLAVFSSAGLVGIVERDGGCFVSSQAPGDARRAFLVRFGPRAETLSVADMAMMVEALGAGRELRQLLRVLSSGDRCISSDSATTSRETICSRKPTGLRSVRGARTTAGKRSSHGSQ